MPIKKTTEAKQIDKGIWKRGHKYVVRVDWNDPKTGRRRCVKRVVDTFEEAQDLRDNPEGRTARKAPTRVRLSDFAERWLSEMKNSLARSTRERYTYSLARISVSLGDYWIDALEPRDIRAWRDELKPSYSAQTINGWLRVFRVVLDRAVEDGDLRFNPARAVKALPIKRTQGARGRALEPEQVRRFVQALEELTDIGEVAADVARHLLLFVWTGVRRGEALALRWDDYRDGELWIERSVYRGWEKETKTDDPRRVAVVAPLAEALAEQRRWLVQSQHPGIASGLMFPANEDQAFAGAKRRGGTVRWWRSPSAIEPALELVIARAELPRVTLQSFRRTFENLGRAAGVDRLVRKSLSGWRTDTAQEIYADVSPAERAAAGQTLVRFVMAG